MGIACARCQEREKFEAISSANVPDCRPGAAHPSLRRMGATRIGARIGAAPNRCHPWEPCERMGATPPDTVPLSPTFSIALALT